MRQIRNLCLVLLVSILSNSCEKSETTDPAPVATRTQLLAQGNWEVDAVHRHQNGTLSEYQKGIINTTGSNYDNLRMKFEVNGTGEYIDESGVSHDMIWEFTTPDERNMRITIGPPFPTTFTWSLVEVKDNYLHTTSPYGSNLISARYKSIP